LLRWTPATCDAPGQAAIIADHMFYFSTYYFVSDVLVWSDIVDHERHTEICRTVTM